MSPAVLAKAKPQGPSGPACQPNCAPCPRFPVPLALIFLESLEWG